MASLAAGPVGYGQAPAAEEVALDALRTRSDISPNDPTLDAWITFRLNRLVEGLQNPDPTVDAAAEFISEYQKQATHAENSASFRDRLAEQSGKRFAAEFEKGPDLEPTVGMALSRTLLALENVNTMDGLVAGLRAKARPAVRYNCAKALTALIPAIQADQARTASTLQLLREVGSQETSGVVLRQTYEAMYYRERLAVAVPAILEVMQAQLRRREKEGAPAEGAEETAIAFFRRELANIADKNRLVAALAMQLRVDVERYVSPNTGEPEKRELERTIDATESLLVQIVSTGPTGPNVRDAMKKTENQDINMPLELYKWIGSGQSTGVLNGPPWNVPVGAPIPE